MQLAAAGVITERTALHRAVAAHYAGARQRRTVRDHRKATTGVAPTKDQERIIELICGREAKDKHGLPTRIYLKEGSPEELEARRALARMLRSTRPLDLGLRYILADMIDPDRDEAERTIRFKNRHMGKRSNALAEKTVARYIEAALPEANGKLESAVAKAMKKFGLERSRVFDIWRMWRPKLKR